MFARVLKNATLKVVGEMEIPLKRVVRARGHTLINLEFETIWKKTDEIVMDHLF